jgi:biopolymer transport protein ExbB
MDYTGLLDQILFLVQRGGWIMIAIFAIGQLGWTVGLFSWWNLRRLEGPTAEFVVRHGKALPAQALLGDKRCKGLFREMAEALQTLRGGNPQALTRKAVEVLKARLPVQDRPLNTLAVVATAAPLLGLLGTLFGIMKTFEVITVYGSGNATLLAGGIAQALMVTESGLVVAIPLLFLHNHLRNRLDHLSEQGEWVAHRLVEAWSTPTNLSSGLNSPQTGRA